jgi:hypothetical protein
VVPDIFVDADVSEVFIKTDVSNEFIDTEVSRGVNVVVSLICSVVIKVRFSVVLATVDIFICANVPEVIIETDVSNELIETEVS